MLRLEKTVFISYRRANFAWARAIYNFLTHNGFDVFIDYTGIRSGDFATIIRENIRARAHFLILLTPTAIVRCEEPGDWLRREIEEAIDCRRNIIPLFLEGFAFKSPEVTRYLTGKLSVLTAYNGIGVPEEYFDAAMTKLSGFLEVELATVLHPLSPTAQQAALQQQTAAARTLASSDFLPVGDKDGNLQSSRASRDLEELLRDSTEDIRLYPNSSEVYRTRADLYMERRSRGDTMRAINDYGEAIRLDPDNAHLYFRRGNAWRARSNQSQAIQDYGAAIQRDATFADAYFSRALTHAEFPRMDPVSAIEDLTKFLQIQPDFIDAYSKRGTFSIWMLRQCTRPDQANARQKYASQAEIDFSKIIELQPDNYEAHFNRGFCRERIGDVQGAIEDFTAAVDLDPKDPNNARYYLRILNPIDPYDNDNEDDDGDAEARGGSG